MRKPETSIRPGRQWIRWAALVPLAAVCALAGAGAQPGKLPQNTTNAVVKLAETPAQIRKDQLAADSAKLLELAGELKAAVDKTTKDQLSLSVIKKADEVEKLARKVREEMKPAAN